MAVQRHRFAVHLRGRGIARVRLPPDAHELRGLELRRKHRRPRVPQFGEQHVLLPDDDRPDLELKVLGGVELWLGPFFAWI